MRTQRFVIRPVLVGLLGASLVLGGVAGLATPASAATCGPENTSRSDFDGDGASDVAVGMPFYADGAGAVDVRGTSTPAALIQAGSVGVTEDDSAGFGQALAIGDLDGDGCADLVIGSPQEEPPGDGPLTSDGAVHILFGSPTGILTTGSVTLTPGTQPMLQFGNAIAVSGSGATHTIYVGAPETKVDGKAAAGVVARYTVTAGAAGSGARVKATLDEVRSQESVGVPGAAEVGDRFGDQLAAADGGVLVGTPLEDVGTIEDAGSVTFLRYSASGPATSQTWSQDSPGVPGVAETDDGFGAAVSVRGSVAAVGVPAENDGKKADSGMVQVFRQKASLAFAPGAAVTQDSKGIPGTLEAGDRFGAAVAVVSGLFCPESLYVAAGAPGEDVGSKKDAGGITAFPVQQEGGCGVKGLRQGSGLAGAAEAGDQVGSVLGVTRGRTDLDEDYADRMLIGVPNEDIGAKANAGLVQPAAGSITANKVTSAALEFSKGYLSTEYYGTELPTSFD